ncbi:MAG: VWA domain-containing protein [Myxococcales bacterium]|nr:VWA domain-containing protein [Myxococcales bacterium]MCB9642353.1 VWA domain-containing protein [Myxococcales bacterium]
MSQRKKKKPSSKAPSTSKRYLTGALFLALCFAVIQGCMYSAPKKLPHNAQEESRALRPTQASPVTAFKGRAARKPKKESLRRRTGHRSDAPRDGDSEITEKKEKEKNGKKVQKQVWQRTVKGTVLSKVSVGGGKYLTLKKLRVTVQVEGLRVRTVMDHIYHNPHGRTLEGTFKYTLPSDASVSYYAMFVGAQQRREPQFFTGKLPNERTLVRMAPQEIAKRSPKKDWGTLREARLVAAEKGREVFEEITRQRIDPALLEQEAPNTFSGRVFPIPNNGYNRVIIAYEQTLPRFQDQRVYSFAFPNDVAGWIDFSLSYNGKLSKLAHHNLRKIRCMQKQQNNFVRCLWETEKPDRNATFYFQPNQKQATWVAGIDPIHDHRYLYGQLAVELPKISAGKGTPQALFMLDTSLSETPERFGISLSLLEKILQKNASIKRFNVLLFDANVQWASPKGWIANTPQEREKLLATLKKVLLEGATDLGAAMKAVGDIPWEDNETKQEADIFFLSDGQVSWGNRDLNQIMSRFQKRKQWKSARFFAYSFGVGSENMPLYQKLVRQGGAVFTCLGPAELERCATAHTHQAMQLEKLEIQGIDASNTLIVGRQASLYPGSLLAFATRYKQDGKAKIILKGRFDGKPIKRAYTLQVKAEKDLAPRAWAEIAINQLVELDDPKLTDLIVAYAQHFHIPNKHCSLLVLETDKEYKRYDLEKAQKTQMVQDLASFIDATYAKKGAEITMRARWREILRKALVRAKAIHSSAGRAAFQLLSTEEETNLSFSSPAIEKLWTTDQVPKQYLAQRGVNPEDFNPFVQEAQRRLKMSMVGSAVRTLSCIVELHPSNSRALRLVGYYLTSWGRPDAAASVFLRVLERRSFEPHAFRDLARTMQKLKRYALASALYEVILAGNWHRRFGEVKTIAREEYALLAYEITQLSKANPDLKQAIQQRQGLLGLQVTPSKLRVTVTWNTDNTDVDLWIKEPGNQNCSYKNKSTPNGGQLLQDITRGYGPERYQIRKAPQGHYEVSLHFFGHRTNVLGNETHAIVVIVLNAGTPEQTIIEKNVVLKKRDARVQVTTVKI